MAQDESVAEPASNRLDDQGLAANEQSTSSPATAVVSLKRKAADIDLEFITIDAYYDLTLLVGRNHPIGMKAFHINRSSMRNVSDVWTKMLTGEWAERKQSEIELPDDDWRAMLLILRMAHLQFGQLPTTLSVQELAALAVLTDKYNLVEVVRVVLETNNWWLPFKAEWTKWPAHPQLQDFTLMALQFRLDTDYEYMVNKLAMEVHVDKEEVRFNYGAGQSLVKLSNSMPERVLSQISDVRNAVLQEWTDCCKTAVRSAVKGQNQNNSEICHGSKCPKALCRVTKFGILMESLHLADLYPIPESPQMMYQSVAWYWRRLKTIGTKFKPYRPCDKAPEHGYSNHVSSCNFDKCFGDFGIVSKAEATLKQYAHEEVLAYLQSDGFVKETT